MTLLSPGQQITELPPSIVTIKGASVSTVAVIGVTVKGPMGMGPINTSWEQFVSRYGAFTANGWVAYCVWAIYKNNPGAKVIVVRVQHYTDITDAATGTGVKALISLVDRKVSSPPATISVVATSEGTWANALKIRITDGATGIFNLEVLETVGGVDILRDQFKGLDMDPTSTNYFETRINGKGAGYISVDDQDSTTTGGLDIPALGTFSLATGADGLGSISDTDFIGDSGSRTGMYALNTWGGLIAFCIPGKTTSAIHLAMLAYAEVKKDRYFVADPPTALGADDIVDYRETTFGGSTDYGEMNWPNLGITDPVTGLTKIIPNSGFILGAMGRTFDDDSKGPWKVAAGIEDGLMFGAVSIEMPEVNDVGARDIVYQSQINPIYFIPGYGICRYGCLTLTPNPAKHQNINERWTFLYCEQSIKDGTVYEAFQNITTSLMQQSERTIKAFLLGVWRRGGLKGDVPTDAFFVQVNKDNNPESSQLLGNLNHKIGLATHTPNQFQYFTFERDTRALQAELAAAGL